MKNRVAFAGKAGAGKTTAAHYYATKHGCTNISFATPLYDILYFAQQRLGFKCAKNREFLCFVGKWARKYARQHNLPDPILANAKRAIDEHTNVVIDDLRMTIEHEFLTRENFTMRKIVGREHGENEMSGGQKNDASEIELDNVHMTCIANAGSIEQFYRAIDKSCDEELINSE